MLRGDVEGSKMLSDQQYLRCASNLLSTLLKDNLELVPIDLNNSDSWFSFKDTTKVGMHTGFHQFQESMDRRLLEPANKEYVRNIILKHEQIFKQQVHELHRLYRVQKMLMAELRKEAKHQSLSNSTPRAVADTNFRFWSSASTSETSHSSHINNRDRNAVQTSTECSSLNPFYMSEWSFRTKNSFNLELAAEEKSARESNLSEDHTINSQELPEEKMSTKTPDIWMNEDHELELTLSIGCGQVKKKSRNWLHQDIDLGCSKMAPTEVSLDRSKECNEASVHISKEGLQRPTWLIQALSLNGK